MTYDLSDPLALMLTLVVGSVLILFLRNIWNRFVTISLLLVGEVLLFQAVLAAVSAPLLGAHRGMLHFGITVIVFALVGQIVSWLFEGVGEEGTTAGSDGPSPDCPVQRSYANKGE